MFLKSRELMEKLSPTTRFSNEHFPFSAHRLIDINGHICRALRISFVGEMGNFFSVSKEKNPFPACRANSPNDNY